MLRLGQRYTKMTKIKEIATVLLGVIVALTLWITILSRERLIGTPNTYHLFHSIPSLLKEIQRGHIGNSFGNIILFVPIGVLAPVVTNWKKMWRTVIAGVGFSLIIETIQLITSRGCFDFDDVVLNGLGCVIGYGIYRAAWKFITKNDLNTSGI